VKPETPAFRFLKVLSDNLRVPRVIPIATFKPFIADGTKKVPAQPFLEEQVKREV